jgi:large subunit ribosomal protein L15
MVNVFTSQLNDLTAKTIDGHALYAAGLIASPYARIKLLSRGEITKAVTVELQGASESAVTAVQKAGGSVKVVPQIGRPVTSEKSAAKAADTPAAKPAKSAKK